MAYGKSIFCAGDTTMAYCKTGPLAGVLLWYIVKLDTWQFGVKGEGNVHVLFCILLNWTLNRGTVLTYC